MARGLRALVAIATLAVVLSSSSAAPGTFGWAVPRTMPVDDARAVSPVFLETGQIGMCVEDTPNIKGLLPQTCCNNMKCPYAKGVCCQGDSHCCPQGTVCVQGDPGTPPGCLHILDHPKVREIAGLPPLPPKPKPAAPPCDPKKDPCCKVCVEPTQPCYCGNNQPVPPPPPPPPPPAPKPRRQRRTRKHSRRPKFPMNGTLTYEDVHAPNHRNDFFKVKKEKTVKHHGKRVMKHAVKLETPRGSFTIPPPPQPPALYDINRPRRPRKHDNRRVRSPPSKVNGKHINDVKPVLKPEELVQSTQPQPVALGLEKNKRRRRDNDVDLPETPKIKEIILNLTPPAKGAPPVASKSFKVDLSEAPRFREMQSSASVSSTAETNDNASSQESDANFPDMSDSQNEEQQAYTPQASSKLSTAKKETSLDKEIIQLFASSESGIPIPI